MKHSSRILILLLLGLARVTVAAFPFPEGSYRGKAVCTDPDGQVMKFDQTLTLRGLEMKTVIHSRGGDETFIKTAHFTGHGRLTWSGSQVARGSGYCTDLGICHWRLIMKPDAAKEEHLKGDLRPPLPPGTTIPGEDTALVRDGQLILVGSATAAGITYVCREVYALK